MAEVNNLDAMDDLDALLDKNLDDIADLPSFQVFHKGAHKAILNWERKDFERTVDGVKKKVPHMQLSLTYIEPIEHTDAKDNENPAKAGDKCSTAYDLTNEFAMGALKKATATLAGQFGNNLKATIQGTNGFEVAVIVNHRLDKNDKDKKYLVVEDMLPA